jgi:putative membrane-bound dehydrogenase-like protein
MRSLRLLLSALLSFALAHTVAAAADAPDAGGKKGKKKAQQNQAPNTEPAPLPTAPPGFIVKRFAGPPEVNYPACLAAAPTGEVFVGIDKNSSLDVEAHRGKIVRCVDTDGDGIADKFSDYVPDLDSPRGMSFAGGTLYVLHPPFVTAFRDEDGDGIAEKRTVLVKGLARDLTFRGADHTANGLRMGIDGWLYLALGDYGAMKAEGTDGSNFKLHGGGVARVRPDGTELELYSTGQRNIYDIAMSPLLEGFTRDNTNDGDGWDVRLSQVHELAQYGYPSLYKNFAEETMAPLADYGGGSGTGAYWYSEPGFPGAFGDMLLTADWGRGAIYRHPLTPKGATYAAKQEVFLNLSRPTDLDADGSSRLYVGSWHGAQFKYVGELVGLVAQVTHQDWKPVPFPNVAQLDDIGLLNLIRTSGAVGRLAASREIIRRGLKPATQSGLVAIAGGGDFLVTRIAAIFTLKQLAGPASHAALLALAEKDAVVREYALRALADRKSQLFGLKPEPFVNALKDANPRVQKQALVALARLGQVSAAPAILPLTEHPDPVVAHTAIKALVTLKAADACLADLRPGSFRALQEMHDPKAVAGLIKKLGVAQDTVTHQAILKTLMRLYNREADWDGKWWTTRPDTTGPYYSPVAWSESPAIAEILKREMESTKDVTLLSLLVSEMPRQRVNLPELAAARQRLVSLNGGAGALNLDSLLKQSKIGPEYTALLEATAMSAATPLATRARAFTGLARIGDASAREAALKVLVEFDKVPDPGPEIRSARRFFVTDLIHARYVNDFIKLSNGSDPARRELALAVLMSIQNTPLDLDKSKKFAQQRLETAWKDAAMLPGLLRAVADTGAVTHSAEVRAALQSPDPRVKQLAERALQMTASGPTSGPLIETLKAEEVIGRVGTMPGNAEFGAVLFTRQGCIACHTVQPDQPLKGPHLGGIATRYNRKELATAILQPNASITQGFETHWFELKDDTAPEGFIVREAADEVEIRNVISAVTVIRKSDILKQGVRPTSIMPEGLAAKLTLDELASLLAYLESTK